MQTFDQHLMDLVADEVVTYETALAASTDPTDFEKQMRFRAPPPAQPPRPRRATPASDGAAARGVLALSPRRSTARRER